MRMSASAVRATVVRNQHHHDLQNHVETNGDHQYVEEENNGTRQRKSSSLSSVHSDLSANEISAISAALNPTYMSTPNNQRTRSRSHSGNSVSFQGTASHFPDRIPSLSLSHQNPSTDSECSHLDDTDEVFHVEGRHSLSASMYNSTQTTSRSTADRDHHVHAPIVGYEIMEERARFTVFKIHVGKEGEDWFIFRRYTDFVRLNDKLKEIFPHFRLSLPPKKWFGDNFDRNFLDDRMLGLQAFLNNITSHRDVVTSEPVKDFFCYDEPPGAHDSLEESKALCETLEEKVYNLKRALRERDAKILLLEEEVALHKAEVDNLRKSLRIERALNSRHKRSSPTSTSMMSIASQRSDSSLLTDQMSFTEADQAQLQKASMVLQHETDSESAVMTPSSTSTDLLENLHDLKLHNIRQSTYETDPNANCEIAEHYGTTISDKLVDNISYSRQESVKTLVDEKHHLDQSGELEWDDDDEHSQLSATQDVADTDSLQLNKNTLLTV